MPEDSMFHFHVQTLKHFCFHPPSCSSNKARYFFHLLSKNNSPNNFYEYNPERKPWLLSWNLWKFM